MDDLAGHIAIISGGLGDIGRAIGMTLAQHGADVALGDVVEPARAEALLNELRAEGVRGRYDRADVSDPAAVSAWVDAVQRDLGTPDLVIVGAGAATFADFDTLTATQWREQMSVNLDGAFHLAHTASRRLVAERKAGRIVFIGSWVADRPQAHIPAYCVSKAGLRMLCRCMAAKLADANILVNEVAPGYVDAGLTAQAFERDPQHRQRAVEHTPIHRLLSAEDVAAQVLHLCAPRHCHATGTTLLLDGGLSLLSRPR